MTRETKTFQIFRAGTVTSMQGETIHFSVSDLLEMANAYNRQLWEAGLVIGHGSMDDMSYGEVRKIYLVGEKLYAEAEVGEALIALVRARSLKNVSAEIYPRDSPANPTPGKLYLRRVAFLGAHPPALKGMDPLNFMERRGNPLVSDAEARRNKGVLFFSSPAAQGNPLVLDAEHRSILAALPAQTRVPPMLFSCVG